MTSREVQRFRAVSEDGQEFTIIEAVNLVEQVVKGQPKTTRPGLAFFRTPAGDHVNKIDDHTFEIVERELRVSRIE